MRLATAAGLAAAAGAASMCVELTAVRLLAPHFGDSAYVWTNVIGVILAAMALGAYWGGRQSDKGGGARHVSWLFLVAGALLALAPLLARELGSALLPQELPLDHAMPAMVRGSLAATAILFATPVFLLGAASPILVGLAARHAPLGRVVGTMSAAATLGSLAGTFGATHLLVPSLGCRTTIWLCAAVIAACGVVAMPSRRGLATGLALLASLALHGGPLREPRPGTELLEERETPYQYLQVVREPDAPGGARTSLKINEGLDSFHSVAVEGSVFTGGAYYDWHAVAPLLAGDGTRPADLRALSIGDAAGSFRRIYDAVHPGARVDAVEIDPACTEFGERHFVGRRAPGDVRWMDGRAFVDHARGRWHVIHVDAYAHQVYIPAHLASREFFAAARQRLEPGGVIACNVGALRPGDPVLQAIGTTLVEEFGNARAFRVPDSRNYLLVARREAADGSPREVRPESLAGFAFGGERLRGSDAEHFRSIVRRAADPRRWHGTFGGEQPLVDDLPRLDRLLHRSYVSGDDVVELVPMNGTGSLLECEQLAHEAATHQDWEGVLAAAARCVEPSSYLRELCGNARWSLRELRSAVGEYQAALALGPGSDAEGRIRTNIGYLEGEIRTADAARAAADRNLFVALGTMALLAGCAFLAIRAA